MKNVGTSERLPHRSVRGAGKEGEGWWPPGVLMQGYDSMGVNGRERAKDVILKKLGSFWK